MTFRDYRLPHLISLTRWPDEQKLSNRFRLNVMAHQMSWKAVFPVADGLFDSGGNKYFRLECTSEPVDLNVVTIDRALASNAWFVRIFPLILG